jgi:hypothetical protein
VRKFDGVPKWCLLARSQENKAANAFAGKNVVLVL